jgi:hypothetical protein
MQASTLLVHSRNCHPVRSIIVNHQLSHGVGKNPAARHDKQGTRAGPQHRNDLVAIVLEAPANLYYDRKGTVSLRQVFFFASLLSQHYIVTL